MQQGLKKELRHEWRETLRLAWPIVLSQVGQMSMGIVDTAISGMVGTNVLAGLGLGSTFFWGLAAVFSGVLLSLDTFFSQSIGAGDISRLHRYLEQALWFSVALSLLCGAVVLSGLGIYLEWGPLRESRSAFRDYLVRVVTCLPPLFLFFVFQRYWQARQVVIAFAAILLAANVVNVFANLALGLGMWGFPRMEAAGIAWSTVLIRYFMLVLAVGYTGWRRDLVPWQWAWPDLKKWGTILRLGLPAGGHALLEVGIFTMAAFLAGFLGPVSLAANHVCLTVATFTFMFPLGISSAAAVRVGMFVGARNYSRARHAAWLCMVLSIGIMGLFGLFFLLFPMTILDWFSDDREVLVLGAKILVIVAFFQVGDGIQVTATGALRGAGDTRSPMVANLVGHYLVGLPVALVFTFSFGWGVTGLWLGLGTGLVTVAALVLHRWIRSSSRFDQLQPIFS